MSASVPPFPGISTTTRLVCLLGHPVAHSVSPQIHNAAFAATGIDAVYLAFDVAPPHVAEAVAGLRGLGVLGANITLPHKREVWELAEARTEEAELVGAANTLFWDQGRLVADNTDALGLHRVLLDDVGLRAGEPVLVFGAGGAARAAAVALGRVGATVQVVARREEAAAAVTRVAAAAGADVTGVDRPRVVINATPLGLRGEALPDRFMHLEPDQVALDLVYGADPSPFVVAARRAGARGIDGLGMLVGQAAGSFARWTGQPAPIEAMSAAVRSAIGR